MKTEFLYQVIDEIEESYIEEAIKMQQNRKKDKPYLKLFLSAAAAAAVIFYLEVFSHRQTMVNRTL